MARKIIVKCKHNFKSTDNKTRSENYTKQWIKIINQMELNKLNKKTQ